MREFIHHKLKGEINITHIVTIFHFEFSKDYAFSGETHPFWELIYVDKGEVIITADMEKYILKAGELAFHQPNEFHDVKANGTVSPNVVVISFSCEDSGMDFFREKILFLDANEKKLLSGIINEGEKAFEPVGKNLPLFEIRRKSPEIFGAEQIIKNDMEKLLISIYRRQNSIHIKQRIIKDNQNHSYRELAVKAVKMLEDSVYKNITLAEIGRELGVSVSHVKKVFKYEMNDSVVNYLIMLKMREAKRLINESSMNFTQIAAALGYDSLAYFSRIFKQKTGMTPSEYALCVKK